MAAGFCPRRGTLPIGALLGVGAVAAGLVEGHRVHGVSVAGAKGNWCLEEEMSV